MAGQRNGRHGQHLPRYGKKMWERVLREHNFRCAKCGQRFAKSQLTKGHLVPDSLGGERRYGNIVPLCSKCNQEDADRLASYELQTWDARYGTDEQTSADLTRLAEERDVPIHGSVEYRMPFPCRVRVTLNDPTVTLRSRKGLLIVALMDDDEYHVRLDDPALFVHPDGTSSEDAMIRLKRREFVPMERDLRPI